jgi:hypothetical protein
VAAEESMSRVILLAAGQGRRMQPLAGDLPKSLLPVRGEPFAVRLLRQAREHGSRDLTVVVGYRAELVEQVLVEHLGEGLRFVLNPRFAEDVNIHSLALALAEAPLEPCLVVEGDIYLVDECWEALLSPADVERSVWYTRGPFLPAHRLGGILRADATGRVTDLRIVPAWEPAYAGYQKLVGVTRVGPAELETYRRLLVAARDRDLRQYYLTPWIDHLDRLPCFARDLGAGAAVSVNTPDEYRQLRQELGEPTG